MDENKLYLAAVPKNFSQTILMSFIAGDYGLNFIDTIDAKALLNLTFQRISKTPLDAEAISKLHFLKARSYHMDNSEADVVAYTISHLKFFIDVIHSGIILLGYKFFPKFDLLRIIYIEQEVSGNETRYWLNFGFDPSITESELSVLLAYIRTRMFGYNAIEGTAEEVLSGCVPTTMYGNIRKEQITAVCKNYGDFENFLNKNYTGIMLEKGSEPICIRMDSGMQKGHVFIISADFYLSKTELVVYLMSRLFAISSRIVLKKNAQAGNCHPRLISLHPKGKGKYNLRFCFQYPEKDAGVQLAVVWKCCIEVLLTSYDVSMMETSCGVSENSELTGSTFRKFNVQSSFKMKDYKFFYEKKIPVVPKPVPAKNPGNSKSSAPKGPTLRELRLIAERESKLRRREERLEEARLAQLKSAQIKDEEQTQLETKEEPPVPEATLTVTAQSMGQESISTPTASVERNVDNPSLTDNGSSKDVVMHPVMVEAPKRPLTKEVNSHSALSLATEIPSEMPIAETSPIPSPADIEGPALISCVVPLVPKVDPNLSVSKNTAVTLSNSRKRERVPRIALKCSFK